METVRQILKSFNNAFSWFVIISHVLNSSQISTANLFCFWGTGNNRPVKKGVCDTIGMFFFFQKLFHWKYGLKVMKLCQLFFIIYLGSCTRFQLAVPSYLHNIKNLNDQNMTNCLNVDPHKIQFKIVLEVAILMI